ncbi:MAG: tetratricopeptide repeat protein [Candidatus Erginobacter occultus]|nr:tetratricopeptide repeat protein [Candidatus Erginobacter occultus]
MKAGFRQEIIFPLLVAVLALLVYANTFHNGFVYDDFREVTENPLVRSLDFSEIFRIYFRQPGSDSPPARVTPLFTYALQHAFHGLEPAGYHLVNILLHGLISLLIYGIVLRLFPGWNRLAFLTAVLFALHPVHADVVNPVAGRSELLASALSLLILLLYLKNTPAPRSARGPWFWFTLPLFLLAVLSKETSWSLPLLMAGCDFYRFRAWPVLRHRLRAFYLPYLLVPVLIFAVILIAGYGPGAGSGWANFLRHLPLLPRLAAAVGIFARYLVILAFPLRLSCDYGYAQLSYQPSAVRLLWTAGGILAGAAGLGLALASLKKTGRYLLAVWLFAAPYLIVSNLVVVINTPMAERLLYLPSWGFCLLLALAVSDLLRRAGRGSTARRVLLLLPAGIIVFYGLRTWNRNRDWRSQTVLMEAALEVCPMSGRVHYNLGRAYELENRLEEALVHYRMAAAILPLNPGMHLNLGNVLVQFGRREEAAAAYREVIRLAPADPRGYSNLGRVSGEMDRWGEAAAAYRRAAELAPADPVIQNSLGIALYRAGDRAGSARAFRQSLALDPGLADPRRNLELLQADPGGGW